MHPVIHQCLYKTVFLLVSFSGIFPDCRSQTNTEKPGKDNTFQGEKRIYNTVHITKGKPRIDGILDDSCWTEGEWAGQFRQQMPTEGAKPSQKTEFKILYDDENVYIAIKAYDTEPDKIDRQMARRDERVGDIVGVNFDSYFDHRTGFEYDVTAAGCKMDLIMTNDNYFDTNWDPIWEAAAARMDSGWAAEMRIPLSQLRYGNRDPQIWGLHVWRWINRNRESDHWNLIPRNNFGYLYNFGELHGLKDLPRVKRIELLPYVLGKIRTYPKQKGNPYADGFDPASAVGLDGKFGIGSNFTVDYTINPDFGQVEADPSELNLTAFETYYEEKRPFFIEGRNIFNYSFDEIQLFYSRRIGHPPQYIPALVTGEYERIPENTSILGALKLTGKTSGGLSVGIVESLTAREFAEISSPEGTRRMVAEPLTNYLTGRIQKDINHSNTIVGGIITSTNRIIDKDYLKGLSRTAITGGIDFVQYLQDKTYSINFKAIGSDISGSSPSITALQQQSSRYYQRPDAPHLHLDTTATSLTGYGGSLEILKDAKGHWRYGLGTHWRSPGLELNDLGYQKIADQFLQGLMLGYVENTPKWIFRTYQLTLTQHNYWDFGGEYLYSMLEFDGSALFGNKWSFNTSFVYNGKSLSTTLLRGGPGVYIYAETDQKYTLGSDVSKKLYGSLEYDYSFSGDRISYIHDIMPSLTWRATTSLQLSSTFLYQRSISDLQYLYNENQINAGKYLLGRLDRNTWMLTFRISYALSPVLTLQYYGSPYITTGHYSQFKTLANADSHDPGKVFHTLDNNELKYDANLREYSIYNEGNPEPSSTFTNPDFNFRQLRSNLVARWEYRPGSVLYLVWTHNRTSSEDVTNDRLGYNIHGLFHQAAENVFLIKFSYWFNPHF